MLSEILKLIEEHERLSMAELMNHFGMTADALEPMMDILLRKGRISLFDFECSSSNSCKGCSCADREKLLIYEIRRT